MKNENNNKEVIVIQILDLLSKETIKSKIEILANIFIRTGLHCTPDINPENISSNTIYEEIFTDIKNNGDTLGNSLVRQGLVLLDWLNEGKKYDNRNK